MRLFLFFFFVENLRKKKKTTRYKIIVCIYKYNTVYDELSTILAYF